MATQFQALIEAILGDERAQAKALLARDSALAAQTWEGDDRYEPGIAHYIYTGDTALHVAAAGCRVEIARLLLDAGADPSSACNRRQSQSLHYASDAFPESTMDAQRQVDILRLLLDAGADLHARDKNGATALHRVVRARSSAAVKFLLEAGCDATIRNKPGSTAFHLAVQNTGRSGSGADVAKAAQGEIIEAFLEHRISPMLRDARGKSVLEWAKSGWIRQALTENRS